MCGVLVLLKKSLNSLVLEETGAAEERLLFLRLEQRPIWAQQDLKHNQDLFTRCVCVVSKEVKEDSSEVLEGSPWKYFFNRLFSFVSDIGRYW